MEICKSPAHSTDCDANCPACLVECAEFNNYGEAMEFAKGLWKQGKQAVIKGGGNDQTVYYQ